jgi:SPP1 gp7 family putative phage head morphogenesis protein
MMLAKDELEKFLNRRTDLFGEALFQLSQRSGQDRRFALLDLSDLIQRTMILADLHGRKRLLMEADSAKRKSSKFASVPDSTPIVPNIPFEEAVEDILSREPRLARSSEEVARMYSSQRVFAMARSVELRLTERVQQAVADLIKGKRTSGKTENEILRMAAEESHDWTRAYAATVYRTNAATAYNNGRFAQAKDEDVREVIPAMQFTAILDDRTRPNHRAAHGLIAPTDDPIWNWIAPPIGFQCRCSADFVSVYELERRGLIQNGRVVRYVPPTFSEAHADSGFTVRRISF